MLDFQAPPPPSRSSPERDVENNNNMVIDAEKVGGPCVVAMNSFHTRTSI